MSVKHIFLKIRDFVLKNKYLVGILILGIILRTYNFKELFAFSHDHDLQGWFVKDVLVNKHLRLIGQETSTQGIFIGPLFYYLLIPFYLLNRMDPIGTVFLSIILGTFTVWSFYFVVGKIFGKKAGLLASFIYSLSFYTVFNDREVVPTMPVILWTVWYLYGIYLMFDKRTYKSILLIAFLTGLIWHINMALVILLPVALVGLLLSKQKLILKEVFVSGMLFTSLSIPLILFEVRHGFSQSKHFIYSITSDQKDIVSGFEKFERVFHLLSKNFSSVVWGDYFDLPFEYVTWGFVLIFLTLLIKKKINLNWGFVFSFWILIYLVFFSFYSKIVSEYYLNGTIAVFIVVLAVALKEVLAIKKHADFAKAFIILITIVNLDRFISIPINRSGYIEKREVVEAIRIDQLKNNYHCVSISYITDPGLDRGYRYFIWSLGLKTKPISEQVPVYTIVFPLKPIFATDKTFGAVGLIYPDYSKYDPGQIEESCAGEDFNSTDPMIGFTS